MTLVFDDEVAAKLVLNHSTHHYGNRLKLTHNEMVKTLGQI